MKPVRTADAEEATSVAVKTSNIQIQESQRKLAAFESQLSELNSEKGKAQMRYENSLKKLPDGPLNLKCIYVLILNPPIQERTAQLG